MARDAITGFGVYVETVRSELDSSEGSIETKSFEEGEPIAELI